MLKTPFVLHPLIGKEIQLEPLEKDHYEFLRYAANDERIWIYMPMKAYGDFFDNWFSETLVKQENGTQITYVVRRLLDQRIVGSSAYYDIELCHKRLEVGYSWFTPAVWGSRVNHESLWLLFQQAFEQWQVNRIQVAADPKNKRSYNTLKKLGAKEEGFLRQHMIHHHGLITDTVIFSILANEWLTVKEKLWNRMYNS
ncbi:GNAT family N-acetyltransferase [Legionella fallonii]|uniref:Acetyltransferase, GNAT family n=1 Tax=Legionella fallonii LLAP-10 TaxID=1212491 RepID=A0A098G812_9GAMM|nr:GNAT family protein [Legionella fallonii]CEG58109.1 Acetyltransferase, GNAT family [Legionella fallonii LLAP-10]